MYELFLLGKLMERPWHGYEFQRVLSSVVGPVRQVSWGTIYPLLRRLEKSGKISRVENQPDSDDGRGRQRYSITPAGRERFWELMRTEHRHDADFRDTFKIMLGTFSRVDIDTRRTIVDRHLDRLTAISRHTEAMSRLVAKVPDMLEPDRKNILLALAHDAFLAESEKAWVQQKMANMLE
jgi:DNA-binding PadR family transcriptional regulator